MKVRVLLYISIGVPVVIGLVWLIAVPTSLIQERIEHAIASAGKGDVSLSVAGLRKGIFLNLSADTLTLNLDQKPALEITDVALNLTIRHLSDFRIAVAINGIMSGGSVHGTIKVPLDGTIYIEDAEINDIPYLKRTGIEIYGTLSSEIGLAADSVDAVFRIPDLRVQESLATILPLMTSFRTMQGAFSLQGNTLKVDSVSLEGDKGYARMKGTITNGIMDLSLELMPEGDKLNAMESMMIGKYIISPGFYVVPIKGPLP